MKNLLRIIAILLILTSCQQKPLTSSLSSTSPDGKSAITVNAKKAAAFDPYTVTMAVKDNGNSLGSLQFEITANNLDTNNVKFNWHDAKSCTIEFTHADGEKRIFSYTANGSNVILQEVK